MADLPLTTLVEALAERLRTEIVSGTYRPGDRLTEQSVAERHEVARPTAKAAIERVVQSGLLRRTANKTARVPDLTEAEIEDIYRARIFLERAAVKVLIKRGIVPPDADGALFDMQRAITADRMVEAVDADVRFHILMVDWAGSPQVARAYRSVMGEARLCMAQERQRAEFAAFPNHSDHVEILAAVRERDADRALRLITDHYTAAAARVVGREPDVAAWIQ
jgi:DNA-binding GntR family transcriptional regulator